MSRLPLQECPNGCGKKHYGPPTSSNCTKHSEPSSARTSGSTLSTKSVRTEKKREARRFDDDIALDDLLETDSAVIDVRDDGVYESKDSIPEQGSYGDSDEFVDAMEKGSGGWKALTGITGQHGYTGALMHPSEHIGGDLEDRIRSEPGQYAVVSVNEESEDGMESQTAGWMLLKKENKSDEKFRMYSDIPKKSFGNLTDAMSRIGTLNRASETGDKKTFKEQALKIFEDVNMETARLKSNARKSEEDYKKFVAPREKRLNDIRMTSHSGIPGVAKELRSLQAEIVQHKDRLSDMYGSSDPARVRADYEKMAAVKDRLRNHTIERLKHF